MQGGNTIYWQTADDWERFWKKYTAYTGTHCCAALKKTLSKGKIMHKWHALHRNCVQSNSLYVQT